MTDKELDSLLQELYAELGKQRKEISRLKKGKDFKVDIQEQKLDLYFKVIVYVLFIVVMIISLTLIIE